MEKESYQQDSETYTGESFRDAPSIPFDKLLFQDVTIDRSTGEVVDVDRFIDDSGEEIEENIRAALGKEVVYDRETWDYYITENLALKEQFMGTGIVICGLNGTGKSTLGKALAEKLHYYFIDNEDLYFPKTDPDYIYSAPRTREEVEKLLFREIKAHENFVFASVKGDYGEAVYPFFRYAVLLEVPKDIRIERVKQRSFQKFGDRMLAGGDLYEQEERFFDLVESRAEDTVEKWLQALNCPIIRIDGTMPVEENIKYIIEQIQK